jgi:mevalonate kinase
MIPSKKYPAKILLFGEYSILAGSEAIAFPYPDFSGCLEYACIQKEQSISAGESQKTLIQLYSHLEKINIDSKEENISLELFRKDMISGVFFNSNIPRNYGVGSSGALTAAIFERYVDQSGLHNTHEILAILSRIESFFHQKSSGIDPFVSLNNVATHVFNGEPRIVELDLNWLTQNLNIFLIDSEIEGSTKQLMDKGFVEKIHTEYINLNNSIIHQILNKNPENLYKQIAKLGEEQLSLFTDLFPPAIMPFAAEGINTGEYVIKLCGSGGGGFFLLFSNSKDVPDEIIQTELKVIPLRIN